MKTDNETALLILSELAGTDNKPEIMQYVIDKFVNLAADIITNHHLDVTLQGIKPILLEDHNIQHLLNGCTFEMLADCKKADLFHGLQQNRVDCLVKKAAEIALEHAVIQHAKDLVYLTYANKNNINN